jgi:hypothetical protein
MALAVPSGWFTKTLDTIRKTPIKNRLIGLMEARKDEFSTPWAATLAAIYMNPDAREYADRLLDEYWAGQVYGIYGFPPVEDLVIGGGVHSAVYAACRAAMGEEPPVVITDRPGGSFAVGGGKPVFRLNSSSRPGMGGLPREANLNYIPGAVVQPNELESGDYPTNAAMRFLIRWTLAAYADVRLGTVAAYGSGYTNLVSLANGTEITPARIVDARGKGYESALALPDVRFHVETWWEFMERMARPFPFQGISSVAIIGGGAGRGNAGNCAVESALNIFGSHYSVPGLDWIRQVDWYNTNLPRTCQEWKATAPARYQMIGAKLPRAVDLSTPNTPDLTRQRRLRTFRVKEQPIDTPAGGIVARRQYDLVVVCAGNTRTGNMRAVPSPSSWPVFTGSRGSVVPVARKLPDREMYGIGTIAALPFMRAEVDDPTVALIPDNVDSMFRTLPYTAAFAMMIP